MKIKMYRQTDKNNTIIEIATAKTKILLDGGVNLEENEVLVPTELQSQYDFSDINAVFLSHYHTDHITMAKGLLENVPVYTSKLTGKIALAAEKYKAKKPFSFSGYYVSGETIAIGDIKVTPYLVDDTIHEAYLLF
ncbi:MAG: MBL fold metallo-hydrolase, partial [Oscillospiraceae bacterium]